MNLWEEIANTKVEDSAKYSKIFARIVHQAKTYQYVFHDEMKVYEDYSIVCEKRANSWFIHLVPKAMMSLFRKMQIQFPNEFQGFSVLCGKKDSLDLRVSCFGVPVDVLEKVLEEHEKI
jgi:hypothetical protein